MCISLCTVIGCEDSGNPFISVMRSRNRSKYVYWKLIDPPECKNSCKCSRSQRGVCVCVCAHVHVQSLMWVVEGAVEGSGKQVAINFFTTSSLPLE